MLTATLTLEPVQRLEHRASPELLAYAELLALPMDELESAVEREVEQNPALERRDPRRCPACGVAASPCLCHPRRRPRALDDSLDPRGLPIADHPTPAQALLDELRPLVPPLDQPILAYVIGCLDGRGLADMSAAEIAGKLRVPIGRVEAVLAVLREHGPAGIGAVDVRECLLLQLDRLEAEGQHHPLARRIVERHLELLAHGRWRMLAAALDAPRAEVLAAAEFIRARLAPPAAVDMPLAPDETAAALPDVMISEVPGEPGTFSVEIVERQRVSLGLGCDYQPERVDRLGDAERQWVELHARRAERFIGRLERRWETMRAVAEAVVARQRDYLMGGPLHIKPLTRAEVAAEVGVHESTVSRATRGRYVLLPSGRLMPFCAFFDAAQAPCAALARLIAEERAPRSDSELARALTRLGFPVARRTVAKYRERLGIPRHTER